MSYQDYSTKRLLKDLRDLEINPLDNISASPLEKDLYTWHVNLRGIKGTPYEGGIFHLIMNFPENYPISPPKIKLCTSVIRSHVYGEWICLDLLETHRTNELYSGWSTVYSVSSILLQLQSYLFDTEDLGEDKTTKQYYKTLRTKEAYTCVTFTKSFKCNSCEHDMKKKNVWPELIVINPTKKKEKKEKIISYSKLPKEVIVEIFSFLKANEIKSCIRNVPFLKPILDNGYLIEREETICFHTKLSFEEDILGYGVNLEYDKNGKLFGISSPLDLISRTAYNDLYIRKSVWRHDFTHWIPLYINPKHGKRALDVAEIYISEILKKDKFEPEDSLLVLSKLMTTQVVEVMKGNLHASIKALEGYFQFHRLLIAFVEKYPKLLKMIDEKVELFLLSEEERSKDQVPNLGEFISLLSVSKYTWNEISSKITLEVLCRNSLWIYKAHGDTLFNMSNSYLDGTCFKETKVSRSLLMFNVFFLKGFARRKGLTLQDIAKNYDKRYGRPSEEDKVKLQNGIFELQNCTSFEEFFNYIELNPIMEIADILRKCFNDSWRRKYHFSKKKFYFREKYFGQVCFTKFTEKQIEEKKPLKVKKMKSGEVKVDLYGSVEKFQKFLKGV